MVVRIFSNDNIIKSKLEINKEFFILLIQKYHLTLHTEKYEEQMQL
jgi:hypothetical protein